MLNKKQIQMEDNIKKLKDQVNEKVNKVQKWSKSHNTRLIDFITKFGGKVEHILTDSVGSDSEEMSFTPEQMRSPRSPEEEEEEPPHV